jgi:UDP-N-acetylglucosamine acyltransferase
LVHKTAIIEGDVIIGDEVQIGPSAYISGKVTIGDRTVIGPFVQIEGTVTIGQDNAIYHSAYIGAPPQDVAYKGFPSSVEIGDNNIIREFVQIHRGTQENSKTVLGSDCFLMGGVHLAHNVKVGNAVTIANYTVLAGYVEVDDFCFISGLTGFHQFVRVGKYVMVGGCSRIAKDCIPFMIVEGNPARVVGLNIVGLRRREFSSERRKKIKECFKLLYRSGKNVSQALDIIRKDAADPDVSELIAFIESSERGIIK